ncbi:MAG: ArnT family glycosyltransferase [Candidatus Methylacidiphilales bacterium]
MNSPSTPSSSSLSLSAPAAGSPQHDSDGRDSARDWSKGAWFVRGWLARPTNAAIVLIALAAIFRLWLCTTLELLPDEAYYFLWSQHLDASYYSKGPGVAWTIATGTWLVGDTTLGIRWLAVLLGTGTAWQLFILARRLYDEETALAALMIVGVIPLFAIGAILMTIDALSVFFWVWTANLFLDALEKGKLWRWALVGFAVGSGFLAKYVNAVQLLSFAAFLIWCPRVRAAATAVAARSRDWIGWRGGFAAMLVVFVICTTPVYYWNAKHDWITVTHLRERAGGRKDPSLKPKDVLAFVLEQGLVISHVLFITVVAASYVACVNAGKWRAPQDTSPAEGAPGVLPALPLRFPDRERFLLTLFLPLMVFYTLLSLREQGEANWTAPSYIAGAILLAGWWRTGFRWEADIYPQQNSIIPGWGRLRPGVLGVAALSLGLLETLALHGTGALNLPVKSDPMNRARGWEALGKAMDELRAEYKPTLILANRYQHASVLSWYMKGKPHTYTAKGDREVHRIDAWPTEQRAQALSQPPLPRAIENQFSFWPTYKVKRGDVALFLTDEMLQHNADGLKAEFEHMDKVGEIDIMFNEKKIRSFSVYVARQPYLDSVPEIK